VGSPDRAASRRVGQAGNSVKDDLDLGLTVTDAVRG
jgi:hypothetical protein